MKLEGGGQGEGVKDVEDAVNRVPTVQAMMEGCDAVNHAEAPTER